MKTKSINRPFIARAAMLLLLLLTTVSAWADLSGKCGSNLYYNYQSSTQRLMIYNGTDSPNGSMTNYDDDAGHPAPWKSCRGEIKKVVIDEGVTSIGNYVFSGCTALIDVTIASTVTSIGNRAFQNCTRLPSIHLPDNVATTAGACLPSPCPVQWCPSRILLFGIVGHLPFFPSLRVLQTSA